MTQALTVRTSQSSLQGGLGVYLSEITKIPVLSREDEKALAMRWYETRDQEAGKKLVMANLRFVLKVARGYTRYGLKLADLIQEGNLGLLHAIDKFDPRKGFRLISYAVWWIRAYIQAYILKSWSLVRMGTTRAQRRVFSGLQKARKMISSMQGTSHEDVKPKQIAAQLKVSEDDVRETIARMKMRDVSIDAPLSPNSEMSYAESLTDDAPSVEDNVISNQLQEKVREKLDAVYEDLAPRERYLLDHRLLSENPITLEAVGHEFGVTRERVRQIESRLKNKLKKVLAPAVGEALPAVS